MHVSNWSKNLLGRTNLWKREVILLSRKMIEFLVVCRVKVCFWINPCYAKKKYIWITNKKSAPPWKKDLLKNHLLIKNEICQYDNVKTFHESYWSKFSKHGNVYEILILLHLLPRIKKLLFSFWFNLINFKFIF